MGLHHRFWTPSRLEWRISRAPRVSLGTNHLVGKPSLICVVPSLLSFDPYFRGLRSMRNLRRRLTPTPCGTNATR